MVLLSTDILIFLLLALAIGYALYARKHEHLRAPWSLVLRSKVGISCMVVLSFYILVGLLDSVHFHPTTKNGAPTGDVISLFDHLVTPLREQQEKTYSAPFAAHLYSKESIDLPDGGQIRGYPRLQWGGAHLEDPQQMRLADILSRTLAGAFEGLLIWLIIAAAFVARLASRESCSIGRLLHRLLDGRSEIPWHVMLYTLAIMLVLTFIALNLATHYHIMGTDKVGEDVFYQALKSIRTGLVIGTLTTLVMLPAAVLLGIMAGYFRGWVDDVIQYIYTTLSSIPGVLLIAAAILMLQVYMSNHADEFNSLVERADLRLLFLCLILGVTSWTGLCRLLRGEAMKLRETDYVQAATAFGVSHFTIITRHILPNVMHIVLISLVLDFSGLVLAEAVLSYVNIGVDPTMNSWGNMINSARMEMAREPVVWWSLVAALLFMFTLVLSANLFSDVVRDAFDPRLRQGK
ncbi:MAG: ABC transporter permease [Candidatus Polarisedimenticolaceae bacterium]|nr:ABC transporter permease [Candidatus Polarisedimenticolaceae bacterium]